MFYRKAAIEIILESPYEFNISSGRLIRPTLFKGSGFNTFVLDEKDSKLRHFSGNLYRKSIVTPYMLLTMILGMTGEEQKNLFLNKYVEVWDNDVVIPIKKGVSYSWKNLIKLKPGLEYNGEFERPLKVIVKIFFVRFVLPK